MELNYLAVLVAALSTFMIGGLWYSPMLFQKNWMRANGFSESDLEKGNPVKIFGVSFLFTLVMAFNLAMFLNDPSTTASWGATAGFLTGFGFVAMSVGTISLFEFRPWSYILVNAGNQIIGYTVMGLILGAWR